MVLQKCQLETFLRLSAGAAKGEKYIISYSKQTGKSVYYEHLKKDSREDISEGKEPRYKFSRKWYEEHLMFTSYQPIQERLEWCEEMFGPQPQNPDAWTRWYTSYTTIRFRDKADYEWYLLRWS